MLEVGEDACFVTPYTEGHQVFGRCAKAIVIAPVAKFL